MINTKTATRSHDCNTKDYIIPHDRIARCDYFGEFRKLANYCWCVFEFLDRYVVNKTSIKKMIDNKQKSPATLLLTGTQLNSIQPFYLDNQNMKAFLFNHKVSKKYYSYYKYKKYLCLIFKENVLYFRGTRNQIVSHIVINSLRQKIM